MLDIHLRDDRGHEKGPVVGYQLSSLLELSDRARQKGSTQRRCTLPLIEEEMH